MSSFEPIVMFFGMTNLPATFQVMMNEILRNLINEGKVAAFIDDVLVGTEIEEGHDKIVEEILRRLEENDLYVKLEKCIVTLPVNLQWKAAFNIHYTNEFLIRTHSRTHYQFLECTKMLCKIVSR